MSQADHEAAFKRLLRHKTKIGNVAESTDGRLKVSVVANGGKNHIKLRGDVRNEQLTIK